MIRALAEGGIDAARALVRESAREDAELQRRLARIRDRLRRQADREARRRIDGYDEALVSLDLAEHRSREELDREIARLEEKLRLARGSGSRPFSLPELSSEVVAALLVPQASWNRPSQPTLWQRIRAWFVRGFRRLFGRSSRKGTLPPGGGRRLPIATLSPDGRSLGASALGEALSRLSPSEETELSQRIGQQIRSGEAELRRTAEAKRLDAEAQRRRLEAEREATQQQSATAVERTAREAEQQRIDRELRERGFVAERGDELVVTYSLVERFARLLLSEEERALPAEVRFAVRGGIATGVYEKARLRQPDEIARLDVPSSLLAARLIGSKHLEESTSFIYREATSESVHVVVAFDRSGSMAEGGKLEAAKKALLALYVAIRRKHPSALVDLLSFENDVRVLDLVELWSARAGAFTNTAEALRVANRLLASSRASRRELYLITDGLPEAYTDAEGRVHSGQLEIAMDQALARAHELSSLRPLKFSLILLRSPHPEYETAARLLARALDGELVITDPNRLGVELLVRWARGTETTQRLPAAAPPSPPSGPVVGGSRRRRSDRRMGG